MKAGVAGLWLLLSGCDAAKERSPSEKSPPPQSSGSVPPFEAQSDDLKQKALARQKEQALAQLRKEVAVHIAQLSSEEAFKKIKEGLALDPQHPDFLRLEGQVKQTLEHLCCGSWLRYDFTKPGAAEKDLHGVLRSQDMGPNHRGYLFRSRLLLACKTGALSLRLRVPWEVPETASAPVDYTLGEEKGSVTVKTNAAPFIYEFPEPKKWAQKFAANEGRTFEARLPLRDGNQGKFTFELGQAKQIVDEILAACK